MIVSLKDGVKLAGISVIVFCAVLVCTMFLNYNMDIISISGEIHSGQIRIFYDAQVMTAKVVSCVSGGCLALTSVVMLIFYIKHYIDTHKKELGILKAMGYSNIKTATGFGIFGLSVLIGASAGFAGAFLIMPLFYDIQNQDGLLPEIAVNFHPLLLFCLIILPTAAFSILSVIYAYIKLKIPALNLLRDMPVSPRIPGRYKTTVNDSTKSRKNIYEKSGENQNVTFLNHLKKNTVRNHKILVFFTVFASFCFSSMTQMSFSMKELASVMMGAMIMMIGITLACTTLFLAITTVVKGSTKTIAMMRVFGYSQKECCHALLGGYRPAAYIGFTIGTVYQYALLRIMVDIVFKDMENIPVYNFDFPNMLISLAFFAVIYEVILYCYSQKIKNISVKEIMLE